MSMKRLQTCMMHAQFLLNDSFVNGLGTIDNITEHAAPKVWNADHKRTSPASVHMESSCLAALVLCVMQMLSLLWLQVAFIVACNSTTSNFKPGFTSNAYLSYLFIATK